MNTPGTKQNRDVTTTTAPKSGGLLTVQDVAGILQVPISWVYGEEVMSWLDQTASTSQGGSPVNG